MQNQEHIIVLVSPTDDGEVTLGAAHDVVARGGEATVVILFDEAVERDIRAFAASEELSFGDAGAIYADRLSATYAAEVGVPASRVVTDRWDAGSELLDGAAAAAATSVVMPQRLLAQRDWRRAVRYSRVPVLITPPHAA